MTSTRPFDLMTDEAIGEEIARIQNEIELDEALEDLDELALALRGEPEEEEDEEVDDDE